MIKESRVIIFILIALAGVIMNNLQDAALVMGILYVVNVIVYSSENIAFREYTLGIYSLNYLISPSIFYRYNDVDYLPYKMNAPAEQYFLNAVFGIIAFQMGIYAYNTKIFKSSFTLAKIQAQLNSRVLRFWVIGGTLLFIIVYIISLPAELTFFLLLVSGLRYVGVFGLISLDFNKNKTFILGTLVYEISTALSLGFFHDLLVWFIFFGLYICYLKKLKLGSKLVGLTFFILLAYFIQNIKSDYRNAIWREGGGDDTFGSMATVSKKKSEDSHLFSEETILNSLVRVNQGWIASSTIEYIDRTQKFTGTVLLYKYLESAILPRFLAPNKLTSGNKEIFNEYSGHYIGTGTSMGLGIIADGYIAFAFWGVVFYCFGLGLLFCLVFYLVSKWSEISPFFALMLFPILYYAVRPDCELQTTLGQLVKGTFTFYLVVRYYRKYFTQQTKTLEQIERILEEKKKEINKRFS